MQNLSEQVTAKIRKSRGAFEDIGVCVRLSKKERQALEDAERLADIFKDVKPESCVFTGDYLFVLPRESGSD